MVTRRQFLKIAGGGASLLLASRYGLVEKAIAAAIPGGTLDPLAIGKYLMPLVVPPAMPRTGKTWYNGRETDYYEIGLREMEQQILPIEPKICWPKTKVWCYGSVNHPGTFNYPGFTIEARYGRPVRVKWLNELVDAQGNYLPHLLPVDPTLHWANPPGGTGGRDSKPKGWLSVPKPYDGPVPIVPHLHGGHTSEESDGYPTAWFLPNAADIPPDYARHGTLWEDYSQKFAQKSGGVSWADGYSVYQYDNRQRATTLWYHDHAMGMTRLNVYAGMAGFYNLRGGDADKVKDIWGGDAILPGPAPALGDRPGTRYCEIPIAIQDRAFNADGSLFYPNSRSFFDGFDVPYIGDAKMASDVSPIWNPEFFGNTMVVNGRTWPYLEVEQRRYRFRLLNGCGSRFLMLKLSSGQSFWQIGSEGGFLPEPVELTELLLAPAERADVIVDFGLLPVGTQIVLENYGPDAPFGGGVCGVDYAPADYGTTGQIMQFRVVKPTCRDRSTPPDLLVLPSIRPLPRTGNVLRQVSLNEMNSAKIPNMVHVDPNDLNSPWVPDMVLDPMTGAMVPNPLDAIGAMLGTVMMGTGGMPMGMHKMWGAPPTETPRAGDTELWEIHNFTMDAHPIHLHQAMFEVVNREVSDPTMTVPVGLKAGTVALPQAWETGLKDTVIAYPGQITRIRVRFDLKGLYVWHCHIIEHEDNEMMRPLLVV